MIGYDAEANAISQYLTQNWGLVDVDIVLPNQEPDQHINPYIRLTIQGADAKNLALGSNSYRYIGVIFIQIFTKPGSGSGKSNEIATALTDLFRDVTINNVLKCKIPKLQNIGVIDGWYQANVSIEFSREEF